MQRKTTWRLALSAVGVAALAAALLPLTNASAAETLNPLATYKTSDGRYINRSINDPVDGQYFVQTDLWNTAVSGGFSMDTDPSSTAFTVYNNTANSYFNGGLDPNDGSKKNFWGQKVCPSPQDKFDPKCDWAGVGDPWFNPKIGADDQYGFTDKLPSFVSQQPPDGLTSHKLAIDTDFGKQIHAPASYPSIVTGCHWGQCSGQTDIWPRSLDGQLYPNFTQARLPSLWNIKVPTGSVSSAGAWDASYDIWLDTNCRPNPNPCSTQGPNLPNNPANLNNPGQNDGTEIMIWVNHNGYNNANYTDAGSPDSYAKHAGTIQPAGIPLMANVGINGIRALDLNNNIVPVTFDVWAGRVRSFDNGIRWNVISFVARTEASQLIADPAYPWYANPDNAGEFDTTAILDFARSLAPWGYNCSTPPSGTPLPSETVPCIGGIGSGWWITSIQAGFEIWYLPKNQKLTSRRFRIF